MNGSFESLQVVIPEIGEFEQPSKQEPSAWSDQYLAGLGQGLQTRRQVWRIADKREFTSGTVSGQVADDHQAAGNADPYLKPLCDWDSQSRNGFDHLQSGFHRTFSIILVGCWKAEVGENSVTHKACYLAAIAANGTVATALELDEDFAEIFRIEPRGQRCRTHEIA